MANEHIVTSTHPVGTEYEAPEIRTIGTVHELTLNPQFCLFGKKWGGSDGLEFMGINVPVSSC